MISLIVPIYSNNFNKHFFTSILEQTNKNFELIIFTNNISKIFTEEIKKIEQFPNIKLSVIFTSKKIGFNETIILGLKNVIGTHMLIVNSHETISKKLVCTLSAIIEKNPDIDILELKTSIRGFEKWTPQKRINLKQNYKFLIKEYPKIVAYSSPFISNKLFKVSLGLSVINQSSYIITSSNLSIEFLYMLYLKAQSYIYFDKNLVNIFISREDIPNYLNFYKEWKSIRSKYELENKLLQEIEYAQMYYIWIIIPLLYSNKKLLNLLFKNNANNKNLLNKIAEKNNKMIELTSYDFRTTNKYMLLNILETEYLNKSHPPNKWPKILKIFKE